MTQQYHRTFTPPVASSVTLDCELVATRRPQNPNDPGAYTGPPDPQDIRGWLDVQTEAYRAAVRAQLTPATVSAWLLNEATDEQLKEVLDSNLPASAKERDSLKSQLSAAVAERDSWERCAKERGESWATAADRLEAARETIRKLEAERGGDVGSELRAAQNVAASLQTELADLEKEHERAKQRLGVQEQKIDAQRDQLRRENQSREKREARVYGLEKERDQLKETIRALTEERDGLKATVALLHEARARRILDEPPRSEEGRPSRHADSVFRCKAKHGGIGFMTDCVECRGEIPATESAVAPCSEEGGTTCRGCGKPLLFENRHTMADGCPCNSARGVNHGLVPTDTCTCVNCDLAQTGSVRRQTLAATTDSRVAPGDWSFAAVSVEGGKDRIDAFIRDDGAVAVAVVQSGIMAGVALEQTAVRRLRDCLTRLLPTEAAGTSRLAPLTDTAERLRITRDKLHSLHAALGAESTTEALEKIARLAPLTDRERRIVSASESLRATELRMALDVELWAARDEWRRAIDLPNTPDVPTITTPQQIAKARDLEETPDVRREEDPLLAGMCGATYREAAIEWHDNYEHEKARAEQLDEKLRLATEQLHAAETRATQTESDRAALRDSLRLATEQVEACQQLLRSADVAFMAGPVTPFRWTERLETLRRERGWT